MKQRRFMTLMAFLELLLLLCVQPVQANEKQSTAISGDFAIWRRVRIYSPRQTVEVRRGEDSHPAEFLAKVVVYPDGRANGVLRLWPFDGAVLRYQVFEGQVQFSDGAVQEVRLRGREIRSGDETVIIVRPDPLGASGTTSGDCLIYDFVGPDVRFEAIGHIEVWFRSDDR